MQNKATLYMVEAFGEALFIQEGILPGLKPSTEEDTLIMSHLIYWQYASFEVNLRVPCELTIGSLN